MFKECYECAKKPGSPVLCDQCLWVRDNYPAVHNKIGYRLVQRKVPVAPEFVVGFLAEGFDHRFNIERGLPGDAKIVNVAYPTINERNIIITVESSSFKSEEADIPLSIVVHELPK